MDTVLIIVAVAAVIAVAALLFLRGRGDRGKAVQEDRREAVALETGAPVVAKPPAREAPAAARETPAAPAAKEEPAAVAEEPEAKPAVVEKPRPQVTEAEIRDQVRTQLEASERMLGELQEAAASKALEELGQSSGSVEILAEGLQEVRALVERKQWSQAKNKGEALHAQLSLLLQSARRETAS